MRREDTRIGEARLQHLTWASFVPCLMLGLLVAAAATLLSACYQPSITNGGLLCSKTAPACPKGYVCSTSGHCYKAGTTPTGGGGGQAPGTGGAGGTDGGVDRLDAGSGGSMVDAAADGGGKDAEVCNQPVANCTPSVPSGCDPVCQTGCGCKEKCSRGVDGVAVCQPSGGFQPVGDSCSISNEGLPNQFDNCVPGAMCLTDGSKESCFAFCNASKDCATYGGLCVNRYLSASVTSAFVSVCDPPLKTCDPFASASASNCANCYITESSASGVSQTVCEPWSGPRVSTTDTCQSSADCTGKRVCPTQVISTAARFHKCSNICDLSGNHSCNPPETCMLIGNRYGYCSALF